MSDYIAAAECCDCPWSTGSSADQMAVVDKLAEKHVKTEGSIVDLAMPWRLGKVPCCFYCGGLLYDEVGKPLAVDATVGWCHEPHYLGRHTKGGSYKRENWVWRDAANYPDAVGEVAEMAANADIPDAPMEDTP